MGTFTGQGTSMDSLGVRGGQRATGESPSRGIDTSEYYYVRQLWIENRITSSLGLVEQMNFITIASLGCLMQAGHPDHCS